MKDILPLVTAQEIGHYIRHEILQTEDFRNSYDENGIVRSTIDLFARRPRFFYHPSDRFVTLPDREGRAQKEYVEAPHFSPWWGGIQFRTYDNPLVQDLYYLHEIMHAASMPYCPDARTPVVDPITFKNKIRDNEHEASTFSEMTIYCEFPQLRRLSFRHEIFVDRFLFSDGDHERVNVRMIQRWREEPQLVIKEMMYARAAILTAPDVDPSDIAAYWLKRFYSQGKAWTAIWTNPKGEYSELPIGGRYREVEKAMVRFREECQTLGRRRALENHIAWLQSPYVTDGTDIPFHREAVAFCNSYLEHKLLYFEGLKRIGKETEVHHKAS